jgi:phosphoadenosine phosphosulfate reductase
MLDALAEELNAQFAGLDAAGRLALLRARLDGRITLTNGFGVEGQILTHLVADGGHDIRVVTLDTGRLFPETYQLWGETEKRYGIRIAAYLPDHAALEALVEKQGVNGFYDTVEQRKACCAVRKHEPMKRALAGSMVWIAGLRHDQSDARSDLPFVEVDRQHNVLKAYPLLDWTRAETLAFIEAEQVPTNPLHARGFLSIGCAPCTRAVETGEDERAGRWWWELDGSKECGLHVTPSGKLVRRIVKEPEPLIAEGL